MPTYVRHQTAMQWMIDASFCMLRPTICRAAGFTLTRIRDLFLWPDWHPEDHPPMPDIVSWVLRPEVRACGSCHRAVSSCGPENANIPVLPIAYF